MMALSVLKGAIMRKVLAGLVLFSLTTVAHCAVIGYHMEKAIDEYGREYEYISYDRDGTPVDIPAGEIESDKVDLNNLKLEELDKDHIQLYDTEKMRTYTIDKFGTRSR